MPLWITCTLAGSIAGYAASTSSRIPALTATTASAPSIAVRSAHDESR